jgi:hypothetical protein
MPPLSSNFELPKVALTKTHKKCYHTDMKRRIHEIMKKFKPVKAPHIEAALTELKIARADQPVGNFGKMIYYSLGNKSIEDFAKEVGVEPATVGSWIKGRKISSALKHKAEIAKACHTNVAYIDAVIGVDDKNIKHATDTFDEIARKNRAGDGS